MWGLLWHCETACNFGHSIVYSQASIKTTFIEETRPCVFLRQAFIQMLASFKDKRYMYSIDTCDWNDITKELYSFWHIGTHHWLCVSSSSFNTKRPKVHLMDSLGLLMPLSPDTVNQIANLINTTKSSFCIEKLSVQQQHGTSDCWPYCNWVCCGMVFAEWCWWNLFWPEKNVWAFMRMFASRKNHSISKRGPLYHVAASMVPDYYQHKSLLHMSFTWSLWYWDDKVWHL